MNPRVGIAVLIIVVIIALALLLRPTTTQPNALVNKPAELIMDKATLAAMKKASAVSTKQANAVQASAVKVAAAAEPALEGYSYLSATDELILSYNVNFDPQQNNANTQKYATALAKNWRIKELEAYKPKKVTIEFYSSKDRVKATRSFDPSGKPL
jgi:hypothetical protein